MRMEGTRGKGLKRKRKKEQIIKPEKNDKVPKIKVRKERKEKKEGKKRRTRTWVIENALLMTLSNPLPIFYLRE